MDNSPFSVIQKRKLFTICLHINNYHDYNKKAHTLVEFLFGLLQLDSLYPDQQVMHSYHSQKSLGLVGVWLIWTDNPVGLSKGLKQVIWYVSCVPVFFVG